MNKSPVVSIITSFFNEENYIKSALKSILNQTYENFELILIDDYSEDNSLEIVNSFSDKRIKIFQKKQENKGLATSRNLGVAMAKGQFITFQDADDTSENTRIEKQLKYALEKPFNKIVGCGVNYIINSSKHEIIFPSKHSEIIKGFQRNFKRVKIVGGTILGNKKIFENFPYRPQFKYMQDWDQLLRMWESGKIEFSNYPASLYNYYLRKGKSVTFNLERIKYNVFLRNCESRRKNGLSEFTSYEEFIKHLNTSFIENIKWRSFIKLKEIQHRLNLFT
jgi:glycosyltransferase involved in cell wall biosynthesis